MSRLQTSPRLRVARCGPEPVNRGFVILLAVPLLLALAGCASGAGAPNTVFRPETPHSITVPPESGGHWLLRHLPVIGALFEPVGLGPCLPRTDQGPPQSCGGWVVLPPGGHVRVPPQRGPASGDPTGGHP